VLPPDGNGLPEQFWNCAEISVVPPGALAIVETAKREEAYANSAITQLQSDKTIIAYWASWQWYDRGKFSETWVFDYRKYTRVNFAFFQTTEQGDLYGTDSWADPNVLYGPFNWNGVDGVDTEYCSWDRPNEKVCRHHHYEKGLIHLVKSAGAEIWPSIGGWSLSDPFPVMAKNPASRNRFAQQCIELIEEYGFDGIDIDWEYPGYTDHSGTPDDTNSYNLLLQVVREKLEELGERTGKFYGLTAALPCGTSHINNIDIPTAAKYLTELNLMTYDYFGAWSPTTGANAPLYDQNWAPPEVARYSIDGCVKNWVEGGGKQENINIGLPFYGRGYEEALHLNETHTGKPDKASWVFDDGIPQYFNIVTKLPELVSVRHELTKTQYAYKPTGGMVTYDDEEAICDKTEYCLDWKLNGFIIWEISGDLMADYSTPLIDAVHAKLQNPSLDCKSFAYDANTFSGYATPFGNEVIASFARPDIPPAHQELSTNPTSQGNLVNKDKQYDPECPASLVGNQAAPDCTSYFHCDNGEVVPPVIVCGPGTLYDETLLLCNHADSVQCTVTFPPTLPPTSLSSLEPTRHPTTYSPTQHPLTTDRPSPTKQPTRNPTPQPSREPTDNFIWIQPDQGIQFEPSFEITQPSQPNFMMAKAPRTNEPTRKPNTKRPTRKPRNPILTSMAGNTMASSFAGNKPPTSPQTILAPTAPNLIEYHSIIKGEESLGENIKNQIQKQKMQIKQQKMAIRKRKKRQKKKKGRQKKDSKLKRGKIPTKKITRTKKKKKN